MSGRESCEEPAAEDMLIDLSANIRSTSSLVLFNATIASADICGGSLVFLVEDLVFEVFGAVGGCGGWEVRGQDQTRS